MKRLFGLKKKKIKVGGDEEDNYSPPSNINVGNRSNTNGDNNMNASNNNVHQQVNEFPNVSADSDNNDIIGSSSIATPPEITNRRLSSTPNNNDVRQLSAPGATTSHPTNNESNSNVIGAGYRYALTAYNDTITPAMSNEDGMGGGGGTLRSRLRGSGGSKHRSLIPSFFDNEPGVGVVDPSSSSSLQSLRATTTPPLYNNTQKRDDGWWAAIPEDPKSIRTPDGEAAASDSRDRVVTFDPSTETDGGVIGPSLSLSEHQQGGGGGVIPPSSTRSTTHISQQSSCSSPHQRNSSSNNHQQQQQQQPPMIQILQPDAIYEEHYGDAYIDQLPKYLYPNGYQSMRPRYGPWKLSIFIFCLFLWLSVFIVGHCYDRGKEYGYYNDTDDNGENNGNNNGGGGDDDGNNNNNNGDNNNNNAMDDAYLAEVDDDAVLMETRWCGSKLLHFMWMISVAITVLAMSYCSIIGYVKVRDVAVANGRSQPAGTFRMENNNGSSSEDSRSGSGSGWRSDYYSKVDNVSGNSGATTAAGGCENDEESGSNTNNADEYSSYQAGGDGNRRYVPSIYQSDGMPQFLGGHIYRPTQAAITMTNRP